MLKQVQWPIIALAIPELPCSDNFNTMRPSRGSPTNRSSFARSSYQEAVDIVPVPKNAVTQVSLEVCKEAGGTQTTQVSPARSNYSERRKSSRSCCCVGVRLLKFSITVVASLPLLS